MTVQTQDQGKQKYARIAKTTLYIGFTVAAVAMAATTIYAAAKGVALSSTFLAYLVNPWAIAIIAFVAAAYLLIGAYQQLFLTEGAKGQDGKDVANGKDADFSVLFSDAVKGAKIVEKKLAKDGGTSMLYLELGNNCEALLDKGNTKPLFLIFKNKEGKNQSAALKCAVKNGYVVVTSVNNTEVNDLAAVRKVLDVNEKADLSAVAVSNESYETLKGDASAKLADVAIEEAIKKSTAKAA